MISCLHLHRANQCYADWLYLQIERQPTVPSQCLKIIRIQSLQVNVTAVTAKQIDASSFFGRLSLRYLFVSSAKSPSLPRSSIGRTGRSIIITTIRILRILLLVLLLITPSLHAQNRPQPSQSGAQSQQVPASMTLLLLASLHARRLSSAIPRPATTLPRRMMCSALVLVDFCPPSLLA